jgi:hypothetical protein
MALSELQQIITEAERLREDGSPLGIVSRHPRNQNHEILDLIIRLAREVDDVLRIATR